MKKIFYGMAIILTFFLSSAAFADYVIKLKNGRAVEVESYWEEEGEVKFHYQGGVAALPKKSILSIVKVEENILGRSSGKKEASPESGRAPRETREIAVPQAESPVPAEGKIEITGEGGKEIPGESKKEIDAERFKKQKAFYTEQYELAYQRYLDATSRSDEQAKKKAWEEFNNYGGKVVSIEGELKKENNGEVPTWWRE